MADRAYYEAKWSRVFGIINQRRELNDTLIQEMLNVRERYNADIVIPLPDVKGEPSLPPIAPALIAEAVDNVAMLAAQTSPYMASPPVDPTKQTGRRSREYADIRRKLLYATWAHSGGNLIRRRAFRHMSGYATATIMVRPDFGLGHPVFEVRDPLGSYPDPKAPEDLSPPLDHGQVFQRSATWLRTTYPQTCIEHGGIIGSEGGAEMWDCAEWVDGHCVLIGILGPRDPDAESADLWIKLTGGGQSPTMLIDAWEDPTGICPVVTLPRVTLDRIASQVAHTVGMVDLQAKILALALVAEEKAVFPDRFAVAERGESLAIISNGGTWMDGRTGEINLVKGARTISALNTPPSQTALQMADRLERNMKVSGTGLVPAMQGETYGALRTGRGIDSMMGAAVDPRVAEVQEILAGGTRHLNAIAMEQYKGYWPTKRFTMQTGWAGPSALVDFTPAEHVEHTHNVAQYPMPGLDAQSLTVTLGQLVGTGAISTRSMRRKHPWIDDAEAEERDILEESLELAQLEAIKQGAAGGQMPVVYVAKIEKAMRKGLDVFEAVLEADKAIREEQATAAPPVEDGSGLAAPPETMPGLAGGPESTMAPVEVPPAIPGPNDSQQGLAQLVDALRATG